MQQRQEGNRHSQRLVQQHSPGRTWNPLRALYWWYFVGSPAAVQQKLGAAQHKLADLQLHRLRNTGEEDSRAVFCGTCVQATGWGSGLVKLLGPPCCLLRLPGSCGWPAPLEAQG